jgi:small-conductance mechanosensitive channel
MNLDEIIYIVIGVCVIIIALLIVSLFQMRSNKLKPRDWIEHPLGIPTGSVRALLALIILLITIWVAISQKLEIAEKMPQWLLAIVGAVIGFYFGNRGLSVEKKKEPIDEIIVNRLMRLRTMRDKEDIPSDEYKEWVEKTLNAYLEVTGGLPHGKKPSNKAGSQ